MNEPDKARSGAEETGWEEGGFRETLLWRFASEEDRRTLRHLGRMLEELAGELSRYSPGGGDSAVRELMRAVAADVRHARGWLAVLARQRKESELPVEDFPLCEVAEVHGETLEEVAAVLEASVEPDRSSRDSR